MSSPEVGSSNISTGGSCMMVRAMLTRCFCPLESLSQRRERNSPMSSDVTISCTRSAISRFGHAVQAAEVFHHLARRQPAIDPGVGGKKADGLAHGIGMRGTRCDPRRSASPPVGRSTVDSMRSAVVFPAPFVPRIPNTSPAVRLERKILAGPYHAAQRIDIVLGQMLDGDQWLGSWIQASSAPARRST